MNVIALDIGGTKIYAARYNLDLEVEAEKKIPTQSEKGKETVCKNILEAIENVKNNKTKAIGISWAGFVDVQNGVILKAPNIPALNNFEICEFIKKETGLPCFLENDARCFALGEQSKNFPQKKVFLGIILGTGVGSGIILEGKTFPGAHGAAGEIGHMQNNGLEIESQLAGPGLEALLKVSKLSDLGVQIPQIKTEIKDLIDPKIEIFSDWLSNLILTLDPDQVVIGGGAGKHFWKHYETEITDRTNQKLENYPVSLELSFSTLKNAGADGAAALAFKNYLL